jgi:cell division protein FtsL
MAVTLCANKIKPATTAVLFFKSQSMLNLTQFELCKLIVLIAAAVVSAKYLERFLVAASRDEPSCVKTISEDVL